MDKNVTFKINSDVYEKFNIALNISGKSADEVVNMCLNWYIDQIIGNSLKEYTKDTKQIEVGDDSKDSYEKAILRIPNWAAKPNQYNHKIIRAYFMSIDIAGEATLIMMQGLCSDKTRQDLYVPNFKNNYYSMKLDNGHSHGKVFEDDGEHVWIYDKVKDTLMQYKNSFYVRKE